MFADAMKIYNITTENSVKQEDLTKVQEWSDNLCYNVSKCQVMHIGDRKPEVEPKV